MAKCHVLNLKTDLTHQEHIYSGCVRLFMERHLYMRKIILLLALGLSLYALEIDNFASKMGYYRDYNMALNTAKKQHKPLMLLVGTDYCPWCRKFERKTLHYPKVVTVIKQKFVAVVIDKNKDKGSYPNSYKSPMTPAVFFINPNNGNVLDTSVGYIRKNDYLEKLESVLFLYSQKGK